jgi:hypothetical protein
MAGDKSVASFHDTFGRDIDSDANKDIATAVAEAATHHQEPTETQFVFNKDQMTRDHKKAFQGSKADGRSMSTAGKMTASTRLKVKEEQKQIEELQLELLAQTQTPTTPTKHAKKQRPY